MWYTNISAKSNITPSTVYNFLFTNEKSTHFLLSEYVKGLEYIWVVGDDFGFKSFNKKFCEQENDNYYMKEQFEICGFNNDKEASYDKNTVSRMRNCLIGAIRDKTVLPKYIVIVLDGDLIDYGKTKQIKTRVGFGRLLKWLMCQYDRAISTQKEYLPSKAKRAEYPTFVWIEPPQHTSFRDSQNTAREEFTAALRSEVSYHTNTFVLQLKKVWDYDDTSLYNRDDKKYTSKGLIDYWLSVDKAVKYCDTILMKKEAKRKFKKENTNTSKHSGPPTDRFHWSKK